MQGTQFLHVVWTGARFVATGDALDGSQVILDSTDGLTWHAQAGSAAAFPGPLAAGPRGVVAVGTLNDRLASWYSKDGLTWTARLSAFPVPTSGPDVIKVTAVVATDTGWLAVGRRDGICTLNCGLAPVSGEAWTSTDGLKWTRVPDQASLAKAAMTGVARLGSGFVAVGLAVRRAVVWTSPDGSTWTRVPDAPMFHPSTSSPDASIQMTGVAAAHGVVVAIGEDLPSLCQDVCGRSVRAWYSTDGKTWAKATGDRFLEGQAFSVNAVSSGFLATGPSGSDSCNGGIWASADGRGWTCIAADAAFGDFGPYAAAGSPTVEIAVGLGGTTPSDGAAPGAVWWRPVR